MGINIGPLHIADPVILAPMSGVTDMPFRRLVKRSGAGLVVSEMIASQAMIRQSRQTLQMVHNTPEEFPMAVQLAGCEPEVMAEAAKLNEDRGAALIDINFGCPVKKVVNGHGGYGRPWFLRQVMAFLRGAAVPPDPSPSEQLAIVIEHYDAMLTHYGVDSGNRIARKHIAWYSKGIPGSAEFRASLNRGAEPAVVQAMIRDFYRP